MEIVGGGHAVGRLRERERVSRRRNRGQQRGERGLRGRGWRIPGWMSTIDEIVIIGRGLGLELEKDGQGDGLRQEGLREARACTYVRERIGRIERQRD